MELCTEGGMVYVVWLLCEVCELGDLFDELADRNQSGEAYTEEVSQ